MVLGGVVKDMQVRRQRGGDRDAGDGDAGDTGDEDGGWDYINSEPKFFCIFGNDSRLNPRVPFRHSEKNSSIPLESETRERNHVRVGEVADIGNDVASAVVGEAIVGRRNHQIRRRWDVQIALPILLLLISLSPFSTHFSDLVALIKLGGYRLGHHGS